MSEPRSVAPITRRVMHHSPLKVAGVLYVVAVFQFFVFELVAETLYPGYSVARNYISDLGGACVNPPSILHCVVHQPTATIFDTTVFLLGLLLLAGAVSVYLGTRRKLYFLTSAVADVAIILVAVFPEPTGRPHAILSVVLFYCLGISLILAWTVTRRGVIRYLVVTFGALTLFFNVANVAAGTVGVGGQERLLVLSALLGLLTLGGYLTGQESLPSPVTARGSTRVGPWAVAATVVTGSTVGLFALTLAVVSMMTRAHSQIPGLVLLLPNLILLLAGVSVILWVVAAVFWTRGTRSRAR